MGLVLLQLLTTPAATATPLPFSRPNHRCTRIPPQLQSWGPTREKGADPQSPKNHKGLRHWIAQLATALSC